MVAMTRSRALATGVALLILSACSFRNVSCGLPKNDVATADPTAPAAPGTAAGSGGGGGGGFEITFLGDSITAGLGLLGDQAFPALIERKFQAEGYRSIEAVNAGISGDTSAGGVRRIEQVLTPSVRVLVLSLGSNDALRGLTLTQTHDNLDAIINAAMAKNVVVLLTGLEAPTNYGADYRDAFRELFTQLLREHKGHIFFVPFLLDGVAGVPALNQSDGIHPNADGARVIADALYPRLRTIVDQIGGGG
jgi:acyl-CoA thioesterase I